MHNINSHSHVGESNEIKVKLAAMFEEDEGFTKTEYGYFKKLPNGDVEEQVGPGETYVIKLSKGEKFDVPGLDDDADVLKMVKALNKALGLKLTPANFDNAGYPGKKVTSASETIIYTHSMGYPPHVSCMDTAVGKVLIKATTEKANSFDLYVGPMNGQSVKVAEDLPLDEIKYRLDKELHAGISKKAFKFIENYFEA